MRHFFIFLQMTQMKPIVCEIWRVHIEYYVIDLGGNDNPTGGIRYVRVNIAMKKSPVGGMYM
jgi:hypothetical protein